jgi:hypothetical protein
MDTIPRESSVGLVAAAPVRQEQYKLDERLRLPTKTAAPLKIHQRHKFTHDGDAAVAQPHSDERVCDSTISVLVVVRQDQSVGLGTRWPPPSDYQSEPKSSSCPSAISAALISS